MEVAWGMNKNQWLGLRGPINTRPSQTPVAQPASRKRPIIIAFNNDRGVELSSLKRPTFEEREPKEYPILPPFLWGTKKAAELLDQWVKDQVTHVAHTAREDCAGRIDLPSRLLNGHDRAFEILYYPKKWISHGNKNRGSEHCGVLIVWLDKLGEGFDAPDPVKGTSRRSHALSSFARLEDRIEVAH